MRRLLFVLVLFVSAAWCFDAQAGCCNRTPLRTVGAVVAKAQPVRRVLEKKVLRKALARLACRG